MLITAQDTDLALQITQDNLIFNTLNPGYAAPLVKAIDQGGLLFATYALTLGSTTGLGLDLPTVSVPTAANPNPPPANPGNPDAFITGVFENALNRAPGAVDLSFYENMIASHPTDAEGYAIVLLSVSLSPESMARTHTFHI